jgi:phage baseplate assembly protein W
MQGKSGITYMVAPLYRGFSTVDINNLDTRLFDANLVKQDILNHFLTRLGDRVARPNFGSIIHDLLFDLSDSRTEGLVYADAERILSQDPRIEPLEIEVTVDHDRYRILVDITMRIVEFDMIDNLRVIFEERS